MKLRNVLAFGAALLVAQSASAHVGLHSAIAGGLFAGLAHPLLGADHLLAMLALGMWAAHMGRRAMIALPIAFVVAMAAGAALAINGFAFPAIEAGLAASVLALGLLVAFAVNLPLGAGVAMTVAFALLHGHAHGNELPAMASPIGYSLGFMATTAMLLGSGVAIGQFTGARLARLAGGVIAFAGLALLATV